MAFNGAFQNLYDMGIYDVILPFVLVFTVVFATLQKVKMFEDKRTNVMIALVMALATVFPHVLWGTPSTTDAVLTNGFVDVIEVLNNSLPNVSVVVIAIIMGLIIIGLLGRRVELGHGSLSGWLAIAAFGAVAYIFGNAAGWWNRPGWLRIVDDPDVMALVIVILVFAIVIWFVTRDQHDPGEGHRIGDQFSRLLQANGGGGHGGGGH